MAEFVLLVSGEIPSGASAGDLGGRTARQAEWVDRLRQAGALLDGGRIDGPSVRVRTGAGRPAVIDVPADAVDAVRSWLLVRALDLPSAVALAGSCPEAAFGDVRVLVVDA
jgi:hypothetical protein